MRENTDQNNSEYGHFLRSVSYELRVAILRKISYALRVTFASWSFKRINLRVA